MRVKDLADEALLRRILYKVQHPEPGPRELRRDPAPGLPSEAGHASRTAPWTTPSTRLFNAPELEAARFVRPRHPGHPDRERILRRHGAGPRPRIVRPRLPAVPDARGGRPRTTTERRSPRRQLATAKSRDNVRQLLRPLDRARRGCVSSIARDLHVRPRLAGSPPCPRSRYSCQRALVLASPARASPGSISTGHCDLRQQLARLAARRSRARSSCGSGCCSRR